MSLAESDFSSALYLSEREVSIEPLSFFRGRKKFKAWKNLAGFRLNRLNFQTRLVIADLQPWQFCTLLGQRTPQARGSIDSSWLASCIKLNEEFGFGEASSNSFPSLNEYLDRGLVNPFWPIIHNAAVTVQRNSKRSYREIDVMLRAQLGVIEQLTRRAVILKLHVETTLNDSSEVDETANFRKFVDAFENPEVRLNFFRAYPVLLRSVHAKLESWVSATEEFLARLENDKASLHATFGLSETAVIERVVSAGDTHNNGRSVLILFFDNGSAIVYKPRSVDLEAAFQSYLGWANQKSERVGLHIMAVASKPGYGWIEFIKHEECKDNTDARLYYFRLGYLTSLVYSINGVDIFFENLVASGNQPVIVDLETMFHTSLEGFKPSGPKITLQNRLFESVAGIGILPQPGMGSTDTELFDVSVMGAKADAKAPYKVTGIENFGNSKMRITEIAGWIPESNASPEHTLSRTEKGEAVLSGMTEGFRVILESKDELIGPNGLICEWFADADRRLIVRDTKAYGTLQLDESHPDLLRDQIDREWHWDNLWADILDRPFLSSFINSELSQLKRGDIPYFSGSVRSTQVTGGDGTIVELGHLLDDTPLGLVLRKLEKLSKNEVEQQLCIAATQLGMPHIPGLTQPNFINCRNSIEISIEIAHFVDDRIKKLESNGWCYNAFNPVPKSTEDPVTTIPIDPSMYDGLSGVALYFCELASATGNEYWAKRAVNLFNSVLEEVDFDPVSSGSGFVGSASIVYAINYCAEFDSAFLQFEPQLHKLVSRILSSVRTEKSLDLLVGLSGTGLALLPYVKRTDHALAVQIISIVYAKLSAWADSDIETDGVIENLDYWRGFSHGLSGIALAIYRLGDYLGKKESTDLAQKLLLKEYRLVQTSGWTDRHKYQDKALVGWCHGAAGIALALFEMSRIREANPVMQEYFDLAVKETLQGGFFDSHCLCHGSIGNLMCLKACGIDESAQKKLSAKVFSSVLQDGFLSFGRAQTMGIGLMTGLVGAGYLFACDSRSVSNLKFLTLR